MRLLFNIVVRSFLLFFLIISPLSAGNNSSKIVKHLGEKLPQNLLFINSEGNEVIIKDLIKKPTIIDFVYYKCTGICTPIMTEVSEVIGKIDYDPGKDYNIISISIDPTETTEMAANKKRIMQQFSKKEIPDSAWTFLIGDSSNINILTDAAGFKFMKNKGGFLHKGVLIFVDKDGKIVQYLSPGYLKQTGEFKINPSEFELAIEKANRGEITATIAKVLQTCITYIPGGKSAMILWLVLASGIITVGVVFVIIKKTKVKKD